MIFSSPEFLFAFLPLTLLGFVLLAQRIRLALGWLVACSLFFYGWWEPMYLLLLGGSVVGNFALARAMARRPALSKMLLIIGVSANLAAIGWFKYAGFLADNLSELFGLSSGSLDIVLPLAISFFTFQQIAFLVDCYRGIAREYNLLDYTLFVCFFPQLIAGPIVHHKDVIPQFAALRGQDYDVDNLRVGLTVLLIGLFKKVVIADGLAEIATPVFAAADAGNTVTPAAAWLGALCYTFQLYFDFSGYSDMAIGAARMFGIRLPENFNSPYKSRSIIDFWRRWHITLSRFLQEYLYIPLGGNRKGPARRMINLMITMLLGGLWHGAGWTFVFWGGLHGIYLMINHGWRSYGGGLRQSLAAAPGYGLVAGCLCFLSVVVAWVFFRAETFAGAQVMLAAMTELGAVADGFGRQDENISTQRLLILGLAATVAFTFPNVQSWMAREEIVLTRRELVANRWHWRRTTAWGVIAAMPAAIALYKIIYMQNRVTEFIYFQF
ncbi:MAG: MBOAT family protein [Gammaproteobacteria bacterium]|nr:MBOAT family protein [Gammaproteobacteria bacterium]